MHPLRIDLLLYGFAVLDEKVFRLLVVDSPHVFGDLVDDRLEAVLLELSLVLLTSGSLDETLKFCLSLHSSPVELLSVVGRIAFAPLANNISLIGRVVLCERSIAVEVRWLHPLHRGRPQPSTCFAESVLHLISLLHHFELSTRHYV